MGAEVDDALAVDFDKLHRTRLGDEILGHDAHAGTYLKDRKRGTGVDSVGDGTGDGQVGQEMLAEVHFGTDLLHGDKGTQKKTYLEFFEDIFDKLDRLVLKEKVDVRGLRDDIFDRWDRLVLEEKKDGRGNGTDCA